MSPFKFLSLLLNPSTAVDEKEAKYDVSVYKRGDLLEVSRTMFTHFGIYLGDNKVAHLIPDILPILSSDKEAIKTMVTNDRLIVGVIAKVASVRVDVIEDFAYGAKILVNHMDTVTNWPPFGGDEVARRAEKLLGGIAYSLLWYNCEHFVMYCRYGTSVSFQTHQFCQRLRRIFCSKWTALLTGLLGTCAAAYQCSPCAALPALAISFTIWMAS